MKAQRHPTSRPRANPQDPRPQLNFRRTSELGSLTAHDDTTASMCFELECPLCACKPAKLEVRIIMDHVLHETYVKNDRNAARPHAKSALRAALRKSR